MKRIILIAVFTAFVAYQASAIDEGVVGVWLFEDGSGDVVTDSSGNDNHATITGAFDWIDGKFGGGLAANGVGLVDVAPSDSVDSPSDELSVAGFFRIDADSDTGIRRQNAFLLEDQSATEPVPNSWSFRVWTSNGISPGAYGTTELDQGVWYHIAGTWDGSTITLYIDGVPEQELVTDAGAEFNGDWGGTINPPADTLQLKYGAESLTGGMDEIVIFNRALTEGEVQTLAASGWDRALSVDPTGKTATTWARVKAGK